MNRNNIITIRNQFQSCMFDDSTYSTEEGYLEELREALTIFDEPDYEPDNFDDEDIIEMVEWVNVNVVT